MKNNTIKKLFLNWLSLADNLQAEKNIDYHSSKEIIKSSVLSHNSISFRGLWA